MMHDFREAQAFLTWACTFTCPQALLSQERRIGRLEISDILGQGERGGEILEQEGLFSGYRRSINHKHSCIRGIVVLKKKTISHILS